jgi:hypothetical protein
LQHCSYKILTAIEHPLSADLSASGASSGNAETLIPFAISASVTLKSGASNWPVWARIPATNAIAGRTVEILIVYKNQQLKKDKKLGTESVDSI